MTHGTDDRARPGHLPAGACDPNTSLVHDGDPSSTAADASGLGAGGGAVATAAAPRPLWLRVLTGQSVAWRIRALRRRVRRLARAVLRRWMRDPRARALFEQGRPLAALRHARHSVPAPPAIRWPTPPAGPSNARPVIGDRASTRPVGWRVPPLDPAIHNPIGFVQTGTVGTVYLRVADLERHARSRASQLRRARVVVCSSTPEDEPHALAAGVVALAAQGVPLLAPSLPVAAAAIFGDPNKVQFKVVTSNNRVEALEKGEGVRNPVALAEALDVLASVVERKSKK